MAKYYIQSGDISFIVCACDIEGAALWVMHRIMDQKICDFEEAKSQWDELLPGEDPQSEGLPTEDHQMMDDIPQAIPYDAMLEGLVEFGESIRLSERGFGHCEAGELQTEDIFHQWRQLMLAVDRLYDEKG